MANTTGVIKLLERLIGQSSLKSKGNYAFRCPFCHHAKKKLEIHPELQHWNCWTCGTKGKSLFTLLKRLNAKKYFYTELQDLVPKGKRQFSFPQGTTPDKICKLPDEYIPLWKPESQDFYWKRCIEYLRGRGISKQDILKYRIGYATDGKYKDMIIFPNFNKLGQLTYFTTRTFSNRNSIKFVNPPFSRDVVGFELQLNWDLPIVLVESALDAMVVRRNSSPLYGTTLPKSLKEQILENKVQDLYLALDPDALRKSIKYAEYFMGFGINVYFVEIPQNTDPNKLGHTKMWELIKSAECMTDNKLFEYKIQDLIA